MTRTRRSAGGAQESEALATRARLLALLREGTWTVDDLAARLELTDNAVRFHLAAMDRDGDVARAGVRKTARAGQPASLYVLSATADDAFSRAYAPVLAACLVEIREMMSLPQLRAFLKRVGRRLASTVTPVDGTLAKRVAGASALLNALGGITTVEKIGGEYHITGRACPLARAVESDPCVCAAVTELVAKVVSANVRERCDRSGRPRCCFQISGPEGPIHQVSAEA